MKKIAYFVFIVWGLLIVCNNVSGECKLQILNSFPLFEKNIGSRKIFFTPTTNWIRLQHSETITAHCNNDIKLNDLKRGKSLHLYCNGDSYFEFVNKNNGYDIETFHQPTIYCSDESVKLNLYESKMTLPNCQSFSSYAIGLKTQAEDIVNVAFCYDLDRLSLKYVNYIAYQFNHISTILQPSLKSLSHSHTLNIDLNQSLGDLTTYFQFMDKVSYYVALEQKQSTMPLLQIFDYVNLIQDDQLNVNLKDFNYLFNVMWLRQLRLGNWRLYLDALATRAKEHIYNVYIGTHGVIRIPFGGNCQQNATLSVKSDNNQVDAPAYIWSYVKSLQPNIDKEFVVIAHNSPYVENPNSSEFCEEDICDEIDWLKLSQFGNMRKKPLLGYMFCCRPADVAAIITNFPLITSQEHMGNTTTTSSTTTPNPNPIENYVRSTWVHTNSEEYQEEVEADEDDHDGN